jgi:hypothetical protein
MSSKTIKEWLSIHIVDRSAYAKQTRDYIDQLEKENKMYRKWINELQVKNSVSIHRIEHYEEALKEILGVDTDSFGTDLEIVHDIVKKALENSQTQDE